MAHNPRKNRILGPAVLLFMVIALAAARTQEIEMTPITLEPLPIAEVTTAHRVVLVGDPPRMILGAMAKKGIEVALKLFEIQGHTASSLATIQLLLPAGLDFDLVADPGKGLSVAYEDPLGATTDLRIQPLGTGEVPNFPPRTVIVSEHRPRFVRGGGMAIIIREYDVGKGKERAVYLEGGATPRRVALCTCRDAMAVATADGLAVVAKTRRSGATIAKVSPGGLILTWPWAAGATPRPLFADQNVFDYDLVGAAGSILVAAVLETGLTIALISPDGTERRIPVAGLPGHLEAFSPALNVSGNTLTLATLAMESPYLYADGPSTLFSGTLEGVIDAESGTTY